MTEREGKRQDPGRQARAEIEVTPGMASAGGDEIWGNSSMIESDQCDELAIRVYRRMELERLTAGAGSPARSRPESRKTATRPGGARPSRTAQASDAANGADLRLGLALI